jgi:hypothetical protein
VGDAPMTGAHEAASSSANVDAPLASSSALTFWSTRRSRWWGFHGLSCGADGAVERRGLAGRVAGPNRASPTAARSSVAGAYTSGRCMQIDVSLSV